ncbi:MAG TPA: hypothetical protein VN950_05170 [Terriglobales bacterium]|nr:hypothetical protein [Terriglobales bacterium]
MSPTTLSSRRLFVRNEGARRNTVLNWHNAPENEFRLYGEAFWDAARRLVERDEMDSGPSADFAACPVVFLYRQALELYLKDILIGKGGDLLDPRPDVRTILERNHSLTKHMPDVRHIFERFGWEKEFGKDCVSTFDDFEEIVSQLEDIDPGSFSFRYPLDKKLGGTLDSHFTFSVRKFALVMDEVLNTLDGACFCLPERCSALWEADYEARIGTAE